MGYVGYNFDLLGVENRESIGKWNDAILTPVKDWNLFFTLRYCLV
jgi:predicted Zn-dependent protease